LVRQATNPFQDIPHTVHSANDSASIVQTLEPRTLPVRLFLNLVRLKKPCTLRVLHITYHSNHSPVYDIKLNCVFCSFNFEIWMGKFTHDKTHHSHGRRQRGASGARPPHLNSVPPHFMFGPRTTTKL